MQRRRRPKGRYVTPAGRPIAGRRRIEYRKEGLLRSQYLVRCSWGRPFDLEQSRDYRLNLFWRVCRWPHPSRRGTSRFENVGYSRRQGNARVWSFAWMRPREG